MPDEPASWRVFEYEGFDIHVLPQIKPTPAHAVPNEHERYVYAGFVTHRGGRPETPGEAVAFHAEDEGDFGSAEDAYDDARHVGRSIIDGTHPDVSVLPLVSHHHPG